MLNKLSLPALLLFALVAGCVTINVYFPAVAAEKAADKIIEDVWGASTGAAGPRSSNQTAPETHDVQALLSRAALAALNFVVPAAQAAEPDLDISSPAVQSIVSDMEARHAQLKPYYESGALGLTENAEITIQNIGTVSLAKRNALKQLVAEENADRNALYREIAVANGHPEWEPKIRATFAQRWISKAQPGWYYQDKGTWRQK